MFATARISRRLITSCIFLTRSFSSKSMLSSYLTVLPISYKTSNPKPITEVLSINEFDKKDMSHIEAEWLKEVPVIKYPAKAKTMKKQQDIDLFWELTIKGAVSNPQMLSAVIDYMKNIERQKKNLLVWSRFYDVLIGSLIDSSPELAFDVHQALYPKCLPRSWKSIIYAAINSNNENAINVLDKIHRSLKPHHRHFYDILIPYLLEKGQVRLAYHSHRLLLTRGDFPRNSRGMNDVLEFMIRYQPPTVVINFIRKLKTQYRKKVNTKGWFNTSTAMLLLPWFKKHDIIHLARFLKAFDDSAKLMPELFWGMLYNCFNSSDVDNILSMFKVQRTHLIHQFQLGSSGSNTEEFKRVLVNMKRENIPLTLKCYATTINVLCQTGDYEKAYSLALDLMMNKKTSLYSSVLKVIPPYFMTACNRAKDPIAYQKLEEFYHLLTVEQLLTDHLRNLHIQAGLIYDNYPMVIKDLEMLISSNGMIEPRTVSLYAKTILFSTNKLKSGKPSNAMTATVSLLFKCHEIGVDIDPWVWRNTLEYTGYQESFETTRNFALWLASTFGSLDLPISSRDPKHPLRIIFNDGILSRIIVWGFKYFPSNPWEGLRLIKELEESGVYVRKSVIKKRIGSIFENYYILPESEVRKGIRERRAKLEVSMDEVVIQCNKIWPGIDIH